MKIHDLVSINSHNLFHIIAFQSTLPSPFQYMKVNYKHISSALFWLVDTFESFKVVIHVLLVCQRLWVIQCSSMLVSPLYTDKGCQKSKPIIKTNFRDLLSFQIPCTYVIPSCKIGQFLCKNHRRFVGEYPTHNFFLSTQVFFYADKGKHDWNQTLHV